MRAVKMVEVGDTGKTPDPHEYVIKDWREVDIDLFDSSVRLIKAKGYRARYRARYEPEHVMTNHYLEIDAWWYWFMRRTCSTGRAENPKARAAPRLGKFGSTLWRGRVPLSTKTNSET